MTDFAEKIRSIGFLRGGRTRARVSEGKQHPETGVPYKATTDEAGNTTTEHSTRDDRVDVQIRAQPFKQSDGPTAPKRRYSGE